GQLLGWSGLLPDGNRQRVGAGCSGGMRQRVPLASAAQADSVRDGEGDPTAHLDDTRRGPRTAARCLESGLQPAGARSGDAVGPHGGNRGPNSGAEVGGLQLGQ
ncbi:MAG: hypothetical protein AAB647_02635, partial [Patescibacteria group bacterium]